MSEHILLLILTILLVCKNALAGIVESCIGRYWMCSCEIGILIGRVLYSYLLPRDLLVRFPTWITRALIVFAKSGMHSRVSTTCSLENNLQVMVVVIVPLPSLQEGYLRPIL